MKVVLASNNSGKLKELRSLLTPLGYELAGQSELGIDAAEEDGLTFVENALAKARHASRHSGLPAIADDSGLVVDALDGAPGIYSARFAGEAASDAENNQKLIESLHNARSRHAHYYCALVFLISAEHPTPLITTGRWNGEITTQARGDNGFGYDPYFIGSGMQQTAAELDADRKNHLSHRGQAVRALCAELEQMPRHAN